MDKPSEEDKKWWFWKGEMFADGDWRDRAIAINTKMNIVHEHMESFRRTLDAVLSGYDGLDELRYHHATAFRWLTMLGYWALGAHAKPKQRSEERRVGKEWFSTCRSRRAPLL